MKHQFKMLLFIAAIVLLSSCKPKSFFSNIAEEDITFLQWPGYEYFNQGVSFNSYNGITLLDLVTKECNQILLSTDDSEVSEFGDLQMHNIRYPVEGFVAMADITYKDKDAKGILVYLFDENAFSFGSVFENKEGLEHDALKPEAVDFFTKKWKIDENVEMTYPEKIASTYFSCLAQPTLEGFFHGATVHNKNGELVRVFGLMLKKD